jgi:putative ABC transport system permease protein
VRLDAPPEPTWYEPAFGAGNQLIVRVRGDAQVMVPPVKASLLAADRRLVVERIAPFRDVVEATVAERRMAARLLATLAVLALALAVLGLYGVLAFGVRQRFRELGVRSALGATRTRLIGLVVRDGLTISAIGVALGLALSVLTTRALRGLLYDVSPTDPATLAGIALILVVASLAASAMPAWTAARVDPAAVLRAD